MNYVEFGHQGLLLLEMYHVRVTVRRVNPYLGIEKEKVGRDAWLPSMTGASAALALECDEGHLQGLLRLKLANLHQMMNLWNLKKKFNLVVLNRALDHLHLPRLEQMPLRCRVV